MMNPTPQPFLQRNPPNYTIIKEEYEVGEQGLPQSSAPGTSTVINMQPEISVPDHVVWSLFNAFFMNVCCLGFAAFAYSVKSRDRKMVGDMVGAQSYASTAKCLNISALVLGIFLNIGIFIGLVILGRVVYEFYYL